MGKYTLVVLSNVTPGHDEDEFNKWYTEQPLGDVVAIPGFTQAQRFKIVGEPVAGSPVWNYYAPYEIETDDPQAVMDEMMRRVGTELMPMSEGLGPDFYVVLYEPISPVVTG